MMTNSGSRQRSSKLAHPRGGTLVKTDESRLDSAVRQMIEVETGRRDRPDDSHVKIVNDPDIAGIRRNLDMTQEQLATMLDVPVATLRNWEQGRRKPSNAGKLVLRLLAETRLPATGGELPTEVRTPSGQPGTLGKAELGKIVSENAGIAVSEALSAIDTVLDTIAAQLKKGGDVRLAGFGNFSVKKGVVKTARISRTGEFIKAEKNNIPKFTAGKGLKDAIN